jgi:hypothetical protein
MYEFHGWISLADCFDEITSKDFEAKIESLKKMITTINSGHPSAKYFLTEINGRNSLLFDAYPNRKRFEVDDLRDLIKKILILFPYSYGSYFEIDHEKGDFETVIHYFIFNGIEKSCSTPFNRK